MHMLTCRSCLLACLSPLFQLCHVHFTRRPDLTAHFKKKHPHARPLNVSSLSPTDALDETAESVPPSPPPVLMTTLMGSPALIPATMLKSPVLAGVHDAVALHSLAASTASWEHPLHAGMSAPLTTTTASAMDGRDLPVQQEASSPAFLLNSLPPVPEMYATLDTHMLLGMSPDTILGHHELLSGPHSPMRAGSMASFSPAMPASPTAYTFAAAASAQQQQQQPSSSSPHEFSEAMLRPDGCGQDLLSSSHASSKALLGSLGSPECIAPELPLLLGLADQALDASSAWQMASVTAAHPMVHYNPTTHYASY
ncbi:hypothetical protein SYNPS1DRAFT_29642 [Syncephalis pseudoplumigaleata]|uniref:C2H2-type domain-containing protein n=1 Tax=Syncephalis pseudoplumigaleata TaxID=1712513 RepID=A0A4V1J1C7_9FUNG|nr:hypothetical protein SYNPS1DRAFT_29642 [Syncephalis pseudoplumigaleata]|eukprot:RKP24599.1 hypothetical protein SYNPS1DRAFT_29642 [Syncephalis pseudoplumigaleata]